MQPDTNCGLFNVILVCLCLNRADCSTLEASNENDTQGTTCELSSDQRIGVYSVGVAFSVLINFVGLILFNFLTVNASRVLHNRMFARILRAPMLFFDTNPSGETVLQHAYKVTLLFCIVYISHRQLCMSRARGCPKVLLIFPMEHF